MKIRDFLLVLTLCAIGVVSVLILPYASVARGPDPQYGYGNEDPLAPTNGLSDLILDEFTMIPDRPRVNEPVTITIQVRNAGTGVGPGWRVNLYVDPPDQPPTTTTPYSKTMAAIMDFPPGATAKVELVGYTFAISGCQHVLYAWADPNEGIPESDETNNMRVIHLCVDPETTALPGADTFEADDIHHHYGRDAPGPQFRPRGRHRLCQV
jgi:hypothetical protein